LTQHYFEFLLEKIKELWNNYNSLNKSQATDMLEYELSELENVFSLLVLGIFTGLPSPPLQISLDLLPDMEIQLIHMLNKVESASNPLSDLSSTLDI
jgi:hypothetical protein